MISFTESRRRRIQKAESRGELNREMAVSSSCIVRT